MSPESTHMVDQQRARLWTAVEELSLIGRQTEPHGLVRSRHLLSSISAEAGETAPTQLLSCLSLYRRRL